jgi:hypothetical protein
MSLAELLSDSKSFNIAGNFDTAYRFVSVDNKIATVEARGTGTAAAGVGVVGSYRGQANVTGGSTLSDVIPTGTIGASASASVMGADLDFKVSAILNDRRDPIELITSGFDTIPLNLEDLSIALTSETMGTLSWGYQPNVFGGVAEKCGAMPGAGTVAAPHKAQFKYTLPSIVSGLEVNLAASQQNRSIDRRTEITSAPAVAVLNTSVTTKPGTEASISYDLGSMLGNYGSVKIGAEILSQKADYVYGANGVAQAKIVDAANDKLSGTGYFVDTDFSGVGICVNKQRTKGLGPLYQTVGGYATNAVDAADTGRRHYDHLNASLNYSIPMASYPIDLAVKYGKTERKGTTTTTDLTLMENKRLGLCLGTDVSDALNFKLCYEKIDSKNGTQVAKTDVGDAKVVSFAGHYKF